MGCSTKCCSIENGGVLVSEARSLRVGGPAQSGLIGVGLRSLIIDPWRIFWERRVGKEKSHENPNRLEKNGRTGGSTEEEGEHVLPIPFALRPCSRPSLVPHFG